MKLAGYLIVENNPSPAPSSQSIRLEMADAGILDPRMHLFFARTRDIANLVLINDIVRLYGLAQRVASFLKTSNILNEPVWESFSDIYFCWEPSFAVANFLNLSLKLW